MGFYDDVLRQIIAAFGAALFVGNLFALGRRRADARRAALASTKKRPGRSTLSKPPAGDEATATKDLPAAPVARTVGYMVLGFVVMVWGVASLVVS